MERTHLMLLTAILVFGMSFSMVFAQDNNGQIHYLASGCAGCHGNQGEGDVLGPSLTTGMLSLARFVAYVREPTGSMPPYTEEILSDSILDEIYDFLTPNIPQQVINGRPDIGEQVYRSKGCYQCHANEGQGGAQGPRLGPDPVSFPRFSWYARNPSGGMPPYTESVLSDQELADIYAFLESRTEPLPIQEIPLLAP